MHIVGFKLHNKDYSGKGSKAASGMQRTPAKAKESPSSSLRRQFVKKILNENAHKEYYISFDYLYVSASLEAAHLENNKQININISTVTQEK